MNRDYNLESFLKNKEKLEKRNAEGIEKYRKAMIVDDNTYTVNFDSHGLEISL